MEKSDAFEKPGKKVVLLGNEAIARGAIEAGIGLAASYPGTPSSEVGIALALASKKFGFYFEWSTNEKVAFEAVAGAAYSGVRAITSMKHFGLNVASDSIFPVVFTGVRAGVVIMVADDPLGHSSAQTEEDTRYFARIGNIPMLEPSNSQECKDFTKLAFEISEKYQIPVILRTTTMVSHTGGSVRLGKIKKPKRKGKFVKDMDRYYNLRPHLQVLHKRVLEKLKKIERDYSKINKIEGNGRIGIITSGISYDYVKEISPKNVKILKLNLTHPISREFISKFLKGLDKIIVIEELEPVLEEFIKSVAKDSAPKIKVYGKDILPRVGEYTTDIIYDALAFVLGLPKHNFSEQERKLKNIRIPVRKPVLCQGCPHRSTFYAVKKVLGNDTVYAGDIGCYALGIFEPFQMQDFVISMGAGAGIAHGIKKVSNQKVVAFMGDSTFFHAGMPPLVNVKSNESNPIVVILDNGITAMTGHQPHPGTGFSATGEAREPVKIENVVSSFGIKNVRVVNAYSQEQIQSTVREFAKKNELGVIISRGTCRLLMKRMLRRQGKSFLKFRIDPKKSKECEKYLDEFACPAIVKKEGRYFIKEDLCWGCSVCSQICPKGAISVVPKKGK